MRASPDDGEPISSPFRLLGDIKAFHRRGQVSLVAAASGGGKSAYATHVAVHGGRVPTLYFSADTDKVTLGTRILAGILNVSTTEAEQRIRDDYDVEAQIELKVATEHIWFCWDAQPSLQDIQDEVEAYGYATGAYPHLIVVDNLINIDSQGEAGHVQKDGVMHWLQQLANITNAHIMVLHHVTGEYEDGDKPIPKSGLLDKVAKRPRLVLTFWKPADNLLAISVVKNSSGKASGDGSYGVEVGWMPERSYFVG